jgi:hypothetical protein
VSLFVLSPEIEDRGEVEAATGQKDLLLFDKARRISLLFISKLS